MRIDVTISYCDTGNYGVETSISYRCTNLDQFAKAVNSAKCLRDAFEDATINIDFKQHADDDWQFMYL